MDILLIAGLWLDGTAWNDVVPELRRLGHHPVPMTLPGQGDGRRSATLPDQVEAVLDAVDSASGPPLVVGHSAACSLAWLAADARPKDVAGVVLIGGRPAPPRGADPRLFVAGGGAPPLSGRRPLLGARPPPPAE